MSVTYVRTGPVVVVTIDRPQHRNAIDRATAEELRSCWHRFDVDEEVAVGILAGAGGHFSAGADLKQLDLVDDPAGFLGFTRLEVSKPTIAAIEGYCVAGGLEMALWCDLRVAGAGARLGFLERRFGVPLVDGGTQRLPLIVGRGRALDLILTGRLVDAGEAERMGLVNRVVPDGDVVTASIELAESIASSPQTTLRSDRAATLAASELHLDRERELGLAALDAGGAREVERFRDGQGRGGNPVAGR